MSFEGEGGDRTTVKPNHKKMAASPAKSIQSGILKPGCVTRNDAPIELVRNEHSDSPIFIRKHQAEDFRCNGVRMSITSLSDGGESTSKQSRIMNHHNSVSSMGSYICLPAVTLPLATSYHQIDYSSLKGKQI